MIVSVQIGFMRGDEEGRMNASVDVPEGEVTVTGLLPVLQGLSSRIADAAVAETGQAISCRAGCGACCRQLVPISVFEAEALADWIRGLPVEQQEMLAGRFASTVNELREKGLLERLEREGWDANSEATWALGIDFLKARVACPFLVNESCAIHPIRPIVCREYVVVSPAAWCAEPWAKQVAGVEVPVKLSKALLRLGEKVDREGKGWIPLMMLMEWMKGGDEPGNAVRGSAQEVLGEVLGALQSQA